MRSDAIRIRLAIFIAGIIVVAGSALFAQAPVLVGRYTAVTANVSGAGDNVRIEMLKWSTDADRDQFLNAFLHPPAPPAPAPASAAAPGGGAPPAGGGRGRGAAPPAVGGAPPAAGGRGVTPPAAGAAAVPPAAGAAAVPPAAGDGTTPPAAARGAAPAGAGRGAAGRGGAPPAAGGAPPLAGDAPAAAAGGRGRGAAPAAAAATVPVVPETPESSLASTLQKANTVGILWTSESAGYSIKYAYRTKTPEGGERIIFATDRRLGAWSDQWWKPTGTAAASNLPITVFELRFGPAGDGEGRTTLTAKIIEDTAAKSIAVENYSAQPVVFKTVKKVK